MSIVLAEYFNLNMEIVHEVKEKYDSNQNDYHNWDHVIHSLFELYVLHDMIFNNQDHKTNIDKKFVFDNIDEFKKINYTLLAYAILFHDVIYIPSYKENELASSLLASQYLTKYDIEFDEKYTIEDLILATDIFNNDQYIGLAFDIIKSIDLCSMVDADAYKRNGVKIRREFKHIDDKKYNEGRVKFIQYMLGKQFIARLYNKDISIKNNLYNELLSLKEKT